MTIPPAVYAHRARRGLRVLPSARDMAKHAPHCLEKGSARKEAANAFKALLDASGIGLLLTRTTRAYRKR